MATYTDNYNLVKPTMAETADIRTINGNMDTIDDIMHATQMSLAPAYDQNLIYNTDDIVMYELLMYKCLEDSVTGSWDATKWERTTAGENGAGGTEVEANPSGTSSADLTKLGINGTIYGIPSGDEVEANPSGTGDTDLTKLGINGTVYNIPSGSGGGGSSQTIADVLWSGAETPTAGNPYTAVLSKSIENYDFVIVDSFENSEGVQMQLLLPVSDIQYNEFYSKYYYNTACYVRFTDASHAELNMFASANPTTYTKVTGLKFCGTLAPMIYSTEEREVGVWIDGKPLYQKSFTGTLIGTETLFSISDLDIDELIKWELMVNSSYDNNPFKAYLSTNADSDRVNTNFYNGNMRIYTSSFWVGSGYFATMFYTKTTDTAGSGSYGSLGVPMKHYDDTEKIVGTWFGETLYEKSFEINLTGNQTNVDISSLNASEIIDYFGTCTYESGNDHFTRKVEYSSYPRMNYYNYFQFDINNGIMEIYSNDYTVYNKIRITVRYTKSS